MTRHQRIRALVRDALLAAILIAAKETFAAMPGEPVTLLLMAYTAVYRFRALVPLYVFVAVQAILYPSVESTLMYLYVWLVLWGIVMLLPKKPLPAPVYMVIGGLYGLAFGTLCAPAHAFYFGLSLKGMVAWIVAGFLSFDVTHGIANFFICVLTPILIRLLMKLEKQ